MRCCLHFRSSAAKISPSLTRRPSIRLVAVRMYAKVSGFRSGPVPGASAATKSSGDGGSAGFQRQRFSFSESRFWRPTTVR